MVSHWRDEALRQLDFYWEYSLGPRLAGLSDAEYFWEPVAGCWSIRPQGEGFTIDWQFPPPEPPPVTTIAWRMAHIAITVFGMRASAHFGDGSLTIATANWPGNAADGVAALKDNMDAWRSGVAALDETALAAPVGAAEPGWEDHPMAALVLHLNREYIHHGAEIALLRDLYRADYGSKSG